MEKQTVKKYIKLLGIALCIFTTMIKSKTEGRSRIARFFAQEAVDEELAQLKEELAEVRTILRVAGSDSFILEWNVMNNLIYRCESCIDSVSREHQREGWVALHAFFYALNGLPQTEQGDELIKRIYCTAFAYEWDLAVRLDDSISFGNQIALRYPELD